MSLSWVSFSCWGLIVGLNQIVKNDSMDSNNWWNDVINIGNGKFNLDLSNIHLLYNDIVNEKTYQPIMQKINWIIVGVKKLGFCIGLGVSWSSMMVGSNGDGDVIGCSSLWSLVEREMFGFWEFTIDGLRYISVWDEFRRRPVSDCNESITMMNIDGVLVPLIMF